MGVRSGEHIKLRGGVYHYRRAVPEDCRKAYGAREKTKSLETRSKSEARRLETELDIEFEAKIAAIRTARDPHLVARSFTDEMHLSDSARFVRGGVDLISRLAEAELLPQDKKAVRNLVLDHFQDLGFQQDELRALFGELGEVFSKRVDPAVFARYRRAAVSLA